MTGTAAGLRRAYEAMLGGGAGPFTTAAPALFSPAVTAQDEANTKGGDGRVAQILLPQEYGSWADEAQAHVRTAYLGDWTSLSKVRLRGPQALEFLGQAGLKDFYTFSTCLV